MVALGGQFLLGFLAGALVGPWIISLAQDIIGGVINMAQGAVGMQGQELGTYGAGYDATWKEDSWIG